MIDSVVVDRTAVVSPEVRDSYQVACLGTQSMDSAVVDDNK